MKKYLWLLLILMPLAVFAASGVNTVNAPAEVNSVTTPDEVNSVTGLAAAGTTCTSYEEQNVDSSTSIIGGTTASDWHKGTIYVAPANIDVCKICVILSSTGDPAGQSYTYSAEIFTLDGSSNLNVSQGETSAVNADNGWNDTQVCFEFATSVSLTSSTAYGITIHRDDGGGGDSTNFVKLSFTSTDESPFDHANEDFCRWQSGGTLGSRFDGWDVEMQVHTDQ
jgi:hypothetical protein